MRLLQLPNGANLQCDRDVDVMDLTLDSCSVPQSSTRDTRTAHILCPSDKDLEKGHCEYSVVVCLVDTDNIPVIVNEVVIAETYGFSVLTRTLPCQRTRLRNLYGLELSICMDHGSDQLLEYFSRDVHSN